MVKRPSYLQNSYIGKMACLYASLVIIALDIYKAPMILE